MVPLDAILIPENRHKRRGRRRKDQLGGSMETIGLDSPVLLSPIGDGKFWLVAGGGRVENAREEGWAEIHAIVKVRDAKAQAASTAAENIAREGLSPAEEADAIEVMIKAGDSPREAAEKVGLTPQTGTLRMPLVELPEEIRGAFHFDGLPPSLAADVKMLYDGNHEIGLEIGALGLEGPRGPHKGLESRSRRILPETSLASRKLKAAWQTAVHRVVPSRIRRRPQPLMAPRKPGPHQAQRRGRRVVHRALQQSKVRLRPSRHRPQ